MSQMKYLKLIFIFLIISTFITSCDRGNTMAKNRQFGIFKVLSDHTTIKMNISAVISSLNNFKHWKKHLLRFTKSESQ